MNNPTTIERKTDRELVSTRLINSPPELVFSAWTRAELFQRWWVPKSLPIALVSCALDARVGGTYRLEFKAGGQTVAFFGRYLEVTPPSRLVWTNDEGGEAAAAITTVTLEARDGKTLVTMSDLHPTKEALDAALASGSTDCTPETFDQLEQLLRGLPR